MSKQFYITYFSAADFQVVAYVWDRYDYGRNVEWYQNVGYPILKPVAQFWLDMLVQDEYFKDGTLVANPCNSPEQGPTVGFHHPLHHTND